MKSVVFRADAAPDIGLGHVIRCTHLARALTANGWQCTLAGTSETIEFVSARGDWPGQYIILDCTDQSEPERIALARVGANWDLLVCDHYKRGIAFESACRDAVDHILVIEDVPNRPHEADILLDQTQGRQGLEYSTLVPNNCRVFCGPAYALLGAEYSLLRQAALQRPRKAVENVMVCVGGGNPYNLIETIIEALAIARLNLRVDIVIGGMVNDKEAIIGQALSLEPEPTLHIDTRNMAKIIARSDLAIGVSGSTSWERCCLGLPALIMTSADNQMEIGRRLAESGAAISMGDGSQIQAETIAEFLASIVENPKGLADMSNIASSICDGAGATKLVAHLEM